MLTPRNTVNDTMQQCNERQRQKGDILQYIVMSQVLNKLLSPRVEATANLTKHSKVNTPGPVNETISLLITTQTHFMYFHLYRQQSFFNVLLNLLSANKLSRDIALCQHISNPTEITRLAMHHHKASQAVHLLSDTAWQQHSLTIWQLSSITWYRCLQTHKDILQECDQAYSQHRSLQIIL